MQVSAVTFYQVIGQWLLHYLLEIEIPTVPLHKNLYYIIKQFKEKVL